MSITKIAKRIIASIGGQYDRLLGFNQPLTDCFNQHPSTRKLEDLGVTWVMPTTINGSGLTILLGTSGWHLERSSAGIPKITRKTYSAVYATTDKESVAFAKSVSFLERTKSGHWKYYLNNRAKAFFTPDEIMSAFPVCVELISAAIKEKQTKEMNVQQREDAWRKMDKANV